MTKMKPLSEMTQAEENLQLLLLFRARQGAKIIHEAVRSEPGWSFKSFLLGTAPGILPID